jgi:cytidine deaminase
LLLIFGETLETPTIVEYSMFAAQAAGLRSSELGRQVGACISSERGDVIALGTNDVPRAGGGLYWPGDVPDMRQFHMGVDSNDEQKRGLVIDTLNRLKESGWLNATFTNRSGEELADIALDGKGIFGRDSRIASLIEFGRAVHAEMAALSDAARRGVSVQDASIYVTTFPCHLCARHIVAAGICKVIYIEPYPKSLTAELYPDSIVVEGQEATQLVKFAPFLGIAPKQYLRLFEALERKKSTTGKVIRLDRRTALPRYAKEEAAYMELEKAVLQTFLGSLKGLQL